jgi:YYY domain-containing protein
VLLDWLSREGWIVISWWALVTAAGAAALPACVRLLGALPDRGYALARAAGLLLVGFTFWLLGSLGFLTNSPGSIALSWVIVLAVSLTLYFRGGGMDWRAWWRNNRAAVITGEILFIVLLMGWALYRANIAELNSTEKPMDMMFMSSILRSPSFPPNDAWLSGYSISYYYFGYVLAAMLAMMSGIHTSIAININIALLFALVGLTVFGVVYNLVRSRAFDPIRQYFQRKTHGGTADDPSWCPPATSAVLTGLLAAVFVVLMGNFEVALVEIPFESQTASTPYLQFWDVNQRTAPNDRIASDFTQWDYWWWWPSSRVVNDHNLNGSHDEVIDEFPNFSYILADNHPHVMSLPYAALALGLALNLLLTGRDPNRSETIFYGLVVGGLIFLNTWDGPIYLAVLVGADGLRRLIRSGTGRISGQNWLRMARFGLTLLLLAVVFYLPFVLGFRSQASGILPNLINPTRPQQYFMMFGPFLLIFIPFLALEIWRARGRINWSLGGQVAGAVGLGVVFILVALVWAISQNNVLRQSVLSYIDNNGGWNAVMPTLVQRRLVALPTTIILLIGIAIVVGRLFPRRELPENDDESAGHEADERRIVTYPSATGFALLLIGVGLVLTLVPDFAYLRDYFGSRMNTVFKFYYQAWLMFSVAAAYGVYTILADLHLPSPVAALKAVSGLGFAVVVSAGMLFPIIAPQSRGLVENGRLNAVNPPPLTMDGGPSFAGGSDYGSIMCLDNFLQGSPAVITEAIGGSYHPEFGRVAALAGIPAVLGWPGHESQWRGGTYAEIAGSRQQDVETLYNTTNWSQAQQILKDYGVTYVFYGATERATYDPGGELKFRDHLEAVCEQHGSKFYHVTESALAAQ